MEQVAMNHFQSCDRYDYLLATACGAIGGLVDIFLVGAPNNSTLGNWSDAQVNTVVEKFAKSQGWHGDSGNVNSAIGFLEKNFHVNYDHRHTGDVGGAFKMSPKNHHLKSLGHSSSPIGLFFSILDQFQEKASFLSNGQLIRIDTTSNSLRLVGSSFPEKLWCGFCNWFAHLMSDVAGSSGAIGRGSGIAIPFFELFQFCNFGGFQIGKDRQDLATLMTRAFQDGYDFRFGIAMAIPVFLTDISIRFLWAFKRHYYHGADWKDCIPSEKHASLRVMLLVGNATLCIFDGADAFIRSGGNALVFVTRLNIIAWFRLVYLILRELMLRYNYTYSDLLKEFQKINQALEEYLAKLKAIDFDGYQREVEELAELNALCASNSPDVTKTLYTYFETHQIELQFHNFEEFDQCNLDPNFILEI